PRQRSSGKVRSVVNSSSIRPLLAQGPRLSELRSRAPELPRVDVDDRTAADLELLGNGGFTPLEGFLGKRDYDSVVEKMRLADGRPWSIPITLAVSKEESEKLTGGDVALWHAGRPVAVLHVKERFGYDKAREARNVF